MVNYQPICLEVSCSNIIINPSVPDVYRVTLTAEGGQQIAYYDPDNEIEANYLTRLYTCKDIKVGMYFSNRDNYIWRITNIISQ